MNSNKEIQKESMHMFYVIEADRDGVRKYVSRAFPRTFPYTVNLSKAERFDSAEVAQRFVNRFNGGGGRYPIVNARIVPASRIFRVEDASTGGSNYGN